MKIRSIVYWHLLPLLFFCISCSNKSNLESGQEIKIDFKSNLRTKLSIKIIELIPLDTSHNCLIGYVSKMKYFKNEYFILDNLRSKTFYIYNRRGEVAYKTERGKGPGEVIDPYTFDIDQEQSQVILHDQASRSLIYYDLDGAYLDREKHPEIFIKDICRISRDSFLVYHCVRDPNAKKTRQYLTYSLYTDRFNSENVLGLILTGDKISQDLIHPIDLSKNDLLFVAPWHYSIYGLTKGKLDVRYVLNFGKLGFTEKELSYLSTYELDEQIMKGNRVGCINSIFKNDDFIVINCEFSPRSLTFFKSLHNKNVYCLNEYFENGLLPYCRIWGINEKGSFYGTVEPDDLIQFQKVSGSFNQLAVDRINNPYIIEFNINEELE